MTQCASPASALDYLCVDQFLGDMVGARALTSAFETGVIDQLLQRQPCTLADLHEGLQPQARYDLAGLQFLLGMLHAHRVTVQHGNGLQLSAEFTHALAYRDLLEAKLHFAQMLAPDFHHLLTALLVEPDKFMAHARVFKLFSYDRCLEPSAENYAHTAQWMRLTTALTKYEAAACIAAYDFSAVRQMLDVGGNSGEFVLRICKAHPHVHAHVYDLPVVCDLGQAHVAAEPQATRIQFIKRNAGQEELPRGYDLINFKSMLHDWPHAHMLDFLARAYAALEEGGKVLIFERSQWLDASKQIGYGQLPLMLFFRSYRAPHVYAQALQALGFHSITVQSLALDMPFALITATK